MNFPKEYEPIRLAWPRRTNDASAAEKLGTPEQHLIRWIPEFKTNPDGKIIVNPHYENALYELVFLKRKV